jgi:hypothetical protein
MYSFIGPVLRKGTGSRRVNKCGPVFAWHAPHTGVNASIYKKGMRKKRELETHRTDEVPQLGLSVAL